MFSHTGSSIKYSVVVPMYNEAETITALYARIKDTMEKVAPSRYEVIFIDDGSTDHSLQILQYLAAREHKLTVLVLDKNYGQSSALQAGIDNSGGEIIITLDADLQNDPADIHKLLEKMAQGYDVVCGWIKNKHDKSIKAYASYCANVFRRVLFKENIHDVGCMLRAYTRNSFAGIRLYGCKHRFLTALLAKKGLKIGEVEVTAYPRLYGNSKYGIMDRLIKSAPEIFDIYFSKYRVEKNKKGYNIKQIIQKDTLETYR
jgi:glycosyltransferase involved in cell wall biosynthesis